MYDMQQDLDRIEAVIAKGPYKDNWESLSAYTVPEWYKQAKFGIFIHWGVYSVPAFSNEWYARNMYEQGSKEYEHHIEKYGPQKDFGYKDFIPMFKAERFDPEEWAALFKEAGARYVVEVAEHHDGFQMYKSRVSHWNAAEMGPCRNVMGDLEYACQREGLVFGTSSHRAEHWFFMGGGRRFDSDIHEPLERGDFYWPSWPLESDHHDLFAKPVPTKEYLDDWLVRTCEIIDTYQPKILYFDWWIQESVFNRICRSSRPIIITVPRSGDRALSSIISTTHSCSVQRFRISKEASSRRSSLSTGRRIRLSRRIPGVIRKETITRIRAISCRIWSIS